MLLGNLSIEEIEARSDVTFPDDLKAYMEPRRQMDAGGIKAGCWHCFDIPFTIVCGDMETAQEIYKHLSAYTSEFKQRLEIAIN